MNMQEAVKEASGDGAAPALCQPGRVITLHFLDSTTATISALFSRRGKKPNKKSPLFNSANDFPLK